MKYLNRLSDYLKKNRTIPNNPALLINTQTEIVRLPYSSFFCDTCFQLSPKMERAPYNDPDDPAPYYTSCCHGMTLSKLDVLERLDLFRERFLSSFMMDQQKEHIPL